MIWGIDVSHYQKEIDFDKMAKGGIHDKEVHPVQFIICKAMYEAGSHRIDEQFERNYEEATKRGIQVGIYIYHASHSLADPVGEARALVNILKGRPLPYGIWHDLEDKTLKVAGRYKINQLVSTEDAILRGAGYNAIGIYCSKDWYDNVLDTASLTRGYPFWIARYGSNTGKLIESNSPIRYAEAWQYTSRGKVDGIEGCVDCDVDFDGLCPSGVKVSGKPENPYREPVANVKRGASGVIVKWIQWELVNHGYSLKIDGVFGGMTDVAVRSFQEAMHLKVDGIVGTATRKALKQG